MERGINQFAVFPLRLGARAGVRRGATPRDAPPVAVAVAPVWRDAVRTLGAHAAPILACACVGCAGPAALTAVIGLTLEGNQPPALCPFRTLPDGPSLIPVLAAALLSPLACGVVARIALNGADRRCGLRAAGTAVLARLPALIAGWLAYGALTAGVMVWLMPALKDARLDPLSVRAGHLSARTLNGVVREVAVRGAGTLFPDPGPAFCGGPHWHRSTRSARGQRVARRGDRPIRGTPTPTHSRPTHSRSLSRPSWPTARRVRPRCPAPGC
jgi:hypothetical protein